jgi:hypothetical protein
VTWAAHPETRAIGLSVRWSLHYRTTALPPNGCRSPGPHAAVSEATSRCRCLGVDRRVEVKARTNGFVRLYDWLAGADVLVVAKRLADPYAPGSTSWWKILNRSYSQKEGRSDLFERG